MYVRVRLNVPDVELDAERYVSGVAGAQVIQGLHLPAAALQHVRQARANEAGAAGNQRSPLRAAALASSLSVITIHSSAVPIKGRRRISNLRISYYKDSARAPNKPLTRL